MAGFSVSTSFTFKSNLQAVKATITGRADKAFSQLAEESVKWVRLNMMHGYSDPHGLDQHTEIYQTGELFRSIKAEFDRKLFVLHQLKVGSDKDYAVYVHNGTRKLKGRAFIRDALIDNEDKIADILKNALKGD